MPRLPDRLRRHARTAAAWLGLVVVALGWMQSLMVCTQPCCGGHVKLTPGCERELERAAVADRAATAAASPGCACCRTAAPVRDAGSDAPARAGQGRCDGCVHVALGVELGMPPAPGTADVALAATFGTPLPPFAVGTAGTQRVEHPPATGPPRCDRRTALRASTLLLL